MRRSILSVVMLSAAVLLTACSSGEIVVPEDSSSQSGQAMSGATLDSQRTDRVLSQIQEAINQGDSTHDAQALSDRVSGPALRMRRAQYALADAEKGNVESLNLEAQTVTLSNSTAWPRAIVDIEAAQIGQLPNLYMITQADARAPYKLESWVKLFGGTQLTTVSAAQGTQMVDAQSTGFKQTPAQALQSYVDMLNSGADGNDDFTTDEFGTAYLKNVEALNESVKEAGSVSAEASVDPQLPISGVVLQDGSAAVAVSFTYTNTYARTVKDSTLKLGGKVATMTDNAQVTGTVTAHYIATVLLQIPPANKDAKITPLGASAVLESVSRDDSKKPQGEE